MALGVFEKTFGVPARNFSSVAQVDSFVEGKTGVSLRPSMNHGNGFVLPQGNVFPLVDHEVDSMVDNALRDQGWLKKLLSMK